jgi:threonine/homoserine/homoserine lactone efflux protein|tara:strand:+ start:89 stop:700 length:612 start_codon:yes stop_codon:yes gene_type:complete
MDIKSLIGISFVCAMGAISPGPSLAVVLRNTISGGRRLGVMTGIGHGIGLGIYAFIAVMGLSSILLANKQIFNSLQWAGALVLIWLAFNMITYSPSDSSKEYEVSGRRGFLEGFMISFLNPKILVFMVAVFSQFINPDITNSGRFIMAIMAGVIDTTWYVFVATVLAGTSIIDKLRLNAAIIDRLTGLVLFMLAIVLIVRTLG